MTEFKNFVLIGAGNLATHLAGRIIGIGGNIIQIFGKDRKNVEKLASETNSGIAFSIDEIDKDADLYLICTPDHTISEISLHLHLKDKPVVHTSGSVSLNEIDSISSNTGVLYPLQTFSKIKHIDFENIPVFVEASNDEFLKQLIIFGKRLTGICIPLDSEKRLKLHLAAVFANNFTNFMIIQAYDIMQKDHLPFSYLVPLLRETLNKAIEFNPDESQTGPARRGDLTILRKHLELLKSDGEKSDIYKLLSDQLSKRYSK